MAKKPKNYQMIRGVKIDKSDERYWSGDVAKLNKVSKTVIAHWLKIGVIKAANDE